VLDFSEIGVGVTSNIAPALSDTNSLRRLIIHSFSPFGINITSKILMDKGFSSDNYAIAMFPVRMSTEGGGIEMCFACLINAVVSMGRRNTSSMSACRGL